MEPSYHLLPVQRVGLLLRSFSRSVRRPLDIIDTLGAHMTFRPRNDDIYLVSYPRSGTTWLQMIVHQIMRDGDTEFAHINDVVPYFERSLRLGRNLDALHSPRIFKTHWRYSRMPKFGKYIYIYRNGKDVMSSYFRFYQSHLNYNDSFADFYEKFIKGNVGGGNWFTHVNDWLENGQAAHCLLLSYEELVNDLRGSIEKIATFCCRPSILDRFPQILEHSSFQYMKRNESRFDFITEILSEHKLQAGHFIRQGRCGSWTDDFTAEQSSRFDALCNGYLSARLHQTTMQHLWR